MEQEELNNLHKKLLELFERYKPDPIFTELHEIFDHMIEQSWERVLNYVDDPDLVKKIRLKRGMPLNANDKTAKTEMLDSPKEEKNISNSLNS